MGDRGENAGDLHRRRANIDVALSRGFNGDPFQRWSTEEKAAVLECVYGYGQDMAMAAADVVPTLIYRATNLYGTGDLGRVGEGGIADLVAEGVTNLSYYNAVLWAVDIFAEDQSRSGRRLVWFGRGEPEDEQITQVLERLTARLCREPRLWRMGEYENSFFQQVVDLAELVRRRPGCVLNHVPFIHWRQVSMALVDRRAGCRSRGDYLSPSDFALLGVDRIMSVSYLNRMAAALDRIFRNAEVLRELSVLLSSHIRSNGLSAPGREYFETFAHAVYIPEKGLVRSARPGQATRNIVRAGEMYYPGIVFRLMAFPECPVFMFDEYNPRNTALPVYIARLIDLGYMVLVPYDREKKYLWVVPSPSDDRSRRGIVTYPSTIHYS